MSVNNLIPAGAPGSVLPVSWTLTGQGSDALVTWDAALTDGYQLTAALSWLAVEDGEDGPAVGTYGACIEARDEDGAQVDSGHPVVCHLLSMEGNVATSLSANSLTAEEWAAASPSAAGTPIAGSVNSAAALGLPDEAAEEEVEAAEEEPAEEEVEEEAADDAF